MRIFLTLVFIASKLAAQIVEPAPFPVPDPLPPVQSPPTAHFTITAQGQTGYDGGSLYVQAPVNGSINVAATSLSTQGSAPITSYNWTVNGISQSCNTSCSATVNMASNSVSLTVTDTNGMSSTASSSVNLSFHSGPVARFSISAGGQTGWSGQTLSVAAPESGTISVSMSSNSMESASPITTYAWTADGAPLPCTSSSCSYQLSARSSIIGLTVTDAQGQTSTATGSIQVVSGAEAERLRRSGQQAPRTSRPQVNLVMTGGGDAAVDGVLSFVLPVDGRVTVTMRTYNALGFPSRGRIQWSVNGQVVCDGAYTCSYPFSKPRNKVAVSVMGEDGVATAEGEVLIRFQ
jgi:hypothetical protein